MILVVASCQQTLHCTHSTGICHTSLLTACEQDQDATARKLSGNLYDIYHCCVYSEKLVMMDRGTVPKHVEFHSKNKFEKLVHLVGFIVRNATHNFHSEISATLFCQIRPQSFALSWCLQTVNICKVFCAEFRGESAYDISSV